jgi:hypothetical protein
MCPYHWVSLSLSHSHSHTPPSLWSCVVVAGLMILLSVLIGFAVRGRGARTWCSVMPLLLITRPGLRLAGPSTVQRWVSVTVTVSDWQGPWPRPCCGENDGARGEESVATISGQHSLLTLSHTVKEPLSSHPLTGHAQAFKKKLFNLLFN